MRIFPIWNNFSVTESNNAKCSQVYRRRNSKSNMGSQLISGDSGVNYFFISFDIEKRV
jgi:hypothetical protein